jgi:hypothetical protein
LSTLRRIDLSIVCALLLGACGDKVPQSEAAKTVGSAPKAAIDRTTTDVNKALQQGADRSRQTEEKN